MAHDVDEGPGLVVVLGPYLHHALVRNGGISNHSVDKVPFESDQSLLHRSVARVLNPPEPFDEMLSVLISRTNDFNNHKFPKHN